MSPEFGTKSKGTVARRAAMMCSNPDCRALTSGPSKRVDRSVNLGEAAHIYGAKLGSARFRKDLSVVSLSEITNAIWLCRNCHKLIDNDEQRFPAEALFEWRKEHEDYVTNKLGTRTAQILLRKRDSKLLMFANCTPLARSIVQDALPGWEFRLTAELLRHFLTEPLRKWSNLSEGLYSRKKVSLLDDEVVDWIQLKNSEAVDLIKPLTILYERKLAEGWGEVGKSGDAIKILQTCELIGQAGSELIRWEEDVRFIRTSVKYQRLVECFPGIVGRHLDALQSVPATLDELVDWAELHPGVKRTVEHTVTFDLPEGWADRVALEVAMLNRSHDTDD